MNVAIDRRESFASLEQVALAWMNIDTTARIIVDESLGVMWQNPVAEKLQRDRHGLEIRGGSLWTTEAAYQSKLRDLILGVGTDPASRCIPRPDGKCWILIRRQCLNYRGQRLFGLTLTIAGEGRSESYHHLDEAFELTRTEHRVLQDLLAGNEAECLSMKHEVSVETTRSHIKSIYAKVGVNSREKLFARLQGFRI